MGFFESWADGMFKKDSSGKHLFFPNGIFGSGYILKDDAHKNRIRDSEKKLILVAFSAGVSICISTMISLGWLVFSLATICIVWCYFWERKITKGLPKSSEKLKLSETLDHFAKISNLVLLIQIELGMLALFVAGLLVFRKTCCHEEALWVIGISLVCGPLFGYLIYLKLAKNRNALPR
jgi:hypothetical protein